MQRSTSYYLEIRTILVLSALFLNRLDHHPQFQSQLHFVVLILLKKIHSDPFTQTKVMVWKPKVSPDDDADDDDNIIAVYEPLKNCGRIKTNEESYILLVYSNKEL